jgi:transposase
MTGAFRGQYTLEFKQEAVRLRRGGESKSSVAKTLGISGQMLHNWGKSEAAGRLREVSGKSVGAEQLEIARLKAEPAKTRVEHDIIKKRRRILRVSRGEIRLCRSTSKSLADNDGNAGCRISAPAAIANIERARRRSSIPLGRVAGLARRPCWFT